MSTFGLHTSVRRGFVAALHDALEMGCTTFQMFTQSPRGWKTRVYTEDEFAAFRHARQKSGLHPVVVHSPYLPNLCTTNNDMYQKSVASLISDLDRCEKLGAEYLVIHPGAYSPESSYEEGLRQIHAALNKGLAAVPGRVKLLIENMAGGGRRIGGKFSEMKDLLNGVTAQDRIGVCFDTCHALAAGYDISTPSGVQKTLDEFDHEVGLQRIHVFHVNDSKGVCGSQRDRHEHLGEGHIGLKGFQTLFQHPAFQECAFILETPRDSDEADRKNLNTLQSFFN